MSEMYCRIVYGRIFYVYCKYITYSISSTTIKYCIVNLFLNVQKAAIDRTEKCGSEHYGFQDWL